MTSESEIAKLADALGDLRHRIKALKDEEAELRKAILDARPNGPVAGGAFSLNIRFQTRRRFDATLLPDHIRADPRYWKETETRIVSTKPAPSEPPHEKVEEFDVFEPY
ncbi:MAG: hypothetical protein EP318_02860 [Rhodobacteraceae bacterium]|nr:MAG: hypothetical protein EP318_02860 [Paracoccaceae bacterium]